MTRGGCSLHRLVSRCGSSQLGAALKDCALCNAIFAKHLLSAGCGECSEYDALVGALVEACKLLSKLEEAKVILARLEQERKSPDKESSLE